MNQKWIISYGWDADVDIVQAASHAEAIKEATKRSRLDGIDDDDLPDHTWAEPYTDDLASQVGLYHYDDRDWQRDLWVSDAPWRT